MKIAIVGGCQCEGLREASLAILPGSEVMAWHLGVNPPDAPQDILRTIRGFDLIISQTTAGQGFDLLTTEALRAEGLPAHHLPTFVFPGFHPDLSYILHPGELISAVHCDFHSRIAVAGFLLGMTPEKALKLYNPLVYAELGYFDVYPPAQRAIEQVLEDAGYKAEGLLDTWLQEIGPFMYMANHPHIRVLATLVHRLYARLGLVPADSSVPAVRKDHLGESFTWPVYPGLAARLGIRGSDDFQRPAWLVPAGETRNIPLGQYLKDLFSFYATLDKNKLETHTMCVARDRIRNLFA